MAKFVKLLPLLNSSSLCLAGVPAAVSGQTTPRVQIADSIYTATEGVDSEVEITVEMTQSFGSEVSVGVDLEVFGVDLDTECSSGGQVEIQDSTVTFSAGSTSETVTIQICDDSAVEQVIAVPIRLERLTSTPSTVTVNTAASRVQITDDPTDTATVGFTLSEFEYQEEDTQPEVGIEVTGEVCFGFAVMLETTDITAVSPIDYAAIVVRVPFLSNCENNNSETRKSVSLSLVNDLSTEGDETFRVTLSRTSGMDPRITISPAEATVRILDDDTVTVALENTFYGVREGAGQLTVCCSISRPDIHCPAPIPFTVRLLTVDGTAESPADYTGLDTILKFPVCARRQCISIAIADDATVEFEESFRVSLERTSALPEAIAIDQRRAVAIVDIVDNDAAIVDFESDEYTITEGGSLDIGVELRSKEDCPVDFGFDIRLGSSVPTGARPYISGIPSLVSFKRCDKNVLTSVSTSDIEATAELRFALEPPSNLDPRISIGQPTAAAYVVDSGGTTQAFETLRAAGNNNPVGIWSDGTTMWVADTEDDKIYAYDMATKARDAGKEFNTLASEGNNNPEGIWSNGTTMWVVDYGDDKIYAYDMATKARDADKEFNSLPGAGSGFPDHIWSDGVTMWVEDGTGDKLYAYNLASKARDEGKDFNTLIAAGNNGPEGIWSDGTTMWVADQADDKIYAYNLATKARDAEKDFNAPGAAGNKFTSGIWSDGTIMWVGDWDDDKIYAYYFPEEPVLPTTIRRRTTITGR